VRVAAAAAFIEKESNFFTRARFFCGEEKRTIFRPKEASQGSLIFFRFLFVLF